MAALEADPGQGPRVYLLITPKNKELLERANQVLLKLARQDAKDKGKPEPVKTSDHRGVVVHALGGDNGSRLWTRRGQAGDFQLGQKPGAT